MKQPKGLVPLRIFSKLVAVPNTIGILRKETILATLDNVKICEGIPEDWMNYICEAVNNYADIEIYKTKQEEISRGLICTLHIPGQPVPMDYGKQVVQDSSGNFSIAAVKEYAKRIRDIKKSSRTFQHLIPSRPVEYPVHVKCTFYMHKTNAKPCLPELIVATLDQLVRLKAVKNMSHEVVASTDGSKIEYILNEPYTIVEIRRMIQ